MFSIEWVTRDSEREIELETLASGDLDELVASCIERLPAMRLRFARMPPDGFVILDDAGTEMRRWFGSVPQDPRQISANAVADETRKTASARRMEKDTHRILVIDDDQSVRLAIEYLLSRRGHIVITAEDGRRALAAFKTSEFDVVMVDMFMRELDGIEVIKILRQRAPAIPIIAMSGFKSLNQKSAPNFLEWALKLGATYCLYKPFLPQQLFDAIHACFADELSQTK